MVSKRVLLRHMIVDSIYIVDEEEESDLVSLLLSPDCQC